jgi:hypothetical protein
VGSIPTASASPLLRKWSARPVEARKEPVRFRRGALNIRVFDSRISSFQYRISGAPSGRVTALQAEISGFNSRRLHCQRMPSWLNGRAPLRYRGDCGFDSRRRLSAIHRPRGETEIIQGYEPCVGGSNPSGDTALVLKRRSFESPKLELRVRFSPRAPTLRAQGADEPHKLGLESSILSAAICRARSLGRPSVLQTEAAGFDSLARYQTRSWRNW